MGKEKSGIVYRANFWNNFNGLSKMAHSRILDKRVCCLGMLKKRREELSCWNFFASKKLAFPKATDTDNFRKLDNRKRYFQKNGRYRKKQY